MAPTMGSMGSHRVGHDCRDLAPAAAADLGHAGIKKKSHQGFLFSFLFRNYNMLLRYQNPVLIFIINTTLKRKRIKQNYFFQCRKSSSYIDIF